MNGGPSSVHTASGAVKHSALGKPGNVGGKRTPGRKGTGAAGLANSLKMLLAPGAGTNHAVKPTNFMRPEAEKKPSVGPSTKVKHGVKPVPGGNPSSAVQKGARVTAKGHVGTHKPFRPEPAVRRDSMSVAKPHSA